MTTRSNRSLRKRSLRRLRARGRSRQPEMLEKRELFYGVDATASEIDLELFAANIASQLELNAVGYAFSASANELDTPSYQVINTADGLAQTAADGEEAFSVDTRMEIASVSKPITGVAVLKLLQDQIEPTIDPGLDPDDFATELENQVDTALDQNLINFLPEQWQDIADPSVNAITIRDLLQHRSGFTSYNLQFAELEELLASGVEGVIGDYDYTTTNYSLLREALPFLWNAVDNDILNGDSPTSNLPADMQQALQDDWGGIEVTADQLSATLFKHYVSTNVLEPSGITNPDMKTGPDSALVYNFDGIGPGLDTGDQTLNGGGRSWNLSASDVQQFAANFRYNDSILHPEVRQLMLDQGLGIFSTNGMFGTYYGHTGANMGGSEPGDPTQDWTIWDEATDTPTSVNKHRVNTVYTEFPNDVVATLVVNSQIGGDPYAAADIVGDDSNGNGNGVIEEDVDGEVVTNNGSWKSEIVKHAYEDALISFVVDGDSGANSFIVRHNQFDSSIIEVLLDDDGVGDEEIVLSRPVSTLASLTLNGLGGSDTFDIDDLPATVNLTIIGESGNDTMTFGGPGDFGFDVQGNITIAAGTGDDEILIRDGNGDSAKYGITESEFTASQLPGSFVFTGISHFSLEANLQSNLISVESPGDDVDISIDAGLGDDVIDVSGVGNASNIDVATGFGTDTVVIADAAAGSTLNLYGPAANPASADTFILGEGDVSLVQGAVTIDGGSGAEDLLVLDDSKSSTARDFELVRIGGAEERITAPGSTFGGVDYNLVEVARINGGDSNDTFNVRSLGESTEVHLWGGPGNDRFFLAQSGEQLSQIEGQVVAHGEDALPPLNPDQLPESQDDDQLILFDQLHDQDDHYTVDAVGWTGSIQKSGFSLVYSGMEDTQLLAGSAKSIFDVERTPTTSGPLRIFGHDGSDLVRITPTHRDQIFVGSEVHFDGGGDADLLQVFDNDSLYWGNYTMESHRLRRGGSADLEYSNLELVHWFLNDQNNLVVVDSTHSGDVEIHGHDGDDALEAQQIVGNLEFFGGNGTDEAKLIGTVGGDEFSVQGEQMRLGTGVLTTSDVEQRQIDGVAGSNSITLEGTVGVDEYFHIQPHTVPHAGEVGINLLAPVAYSQVQRVDVLGNDVDNDTLQMDGAINPDPAASQTIADTFEVFLGAAGTDVDPIVQLTSDLGEDLLTLRNYEGIDLLQLDGLAGDDEFNVNIPSDYAVANRFLYVDGDRGNDSLTAKVDAADIIFNDYGDGSGDMDFLFGPELDSQFYLFYDSIEDAGLAKRRGSLAILRSAALEQRPSR